MNKAVEINKSFHFEKSDNVAIASLKQSWQETLVAPQDGMWEALTNMAVQWKIMTDSDQPIGYASVNAENLLLQFYLEEEWLSEGRLIFSSFIKQLQIKECIVGTNNPTFMSLALHFQKSVDVHTYLFTDCVDVLPDNQVGVLRQAESGDLDNLVQFCHESMGGPKEWLTGYLGDLIERQELFVLEKETEILGTCEVRKSETDPNVADVGMIVSAKRRRQGLGTYLLGQAKAIAKKWGREPICSCEKDNLGSLRSIEKNGFRSMHQMLSVKFLVD